MSKDIRIGEVYVLHCLVNGKEYVGQTICGYLTRLRGHIKAARNGNEQPLYRALRRYGMDNFTIDIVWRGSAAELNAAEKRFIQQRKTFIDTGWGYNLTTGGGQYVMSEETRRKIAESSRKMWDTAQYREKQKYTPQRAQLVSEFAKARSAAGPYQTEESCKKIADGIRKAWAKPGAREIWKEALRSGWDDEARKHASEVTSLRTTTKEFKEASSIWQKAKWSDPVYKESMRDKAREIRKTLWGDEEFKANAIAKLQAALTPEVIAKRSASIRSAWEDPEMHKRQSEAVRRSWITRRQKGEKS